MNRYKRLISGHLLLSIILWYTFGCIEATSSQQRKLTETEKVAVHLAQAQLDAYNARDLERFLEPYSDSVQVFNFPSQPRMSGKAAMRQVYGSFFASAPNLHCKLEQRMVMDSIVIDQERVTGATDDPTKVIRALAIYTISKGKISQVRFVMGHPHQ